VRLFILTRVAPSLYLKVGLGEKVRPARKKSDRRSDNREVRLGVRQNGEGKVGKKRVIMLIRFLRVTRVIRIYKVLEL
jgi:hypothetical protein